MAKEEKLFSVQSKLSDRDFDDVFRIYLDMERGRDRRISLIICTGFCVLFVLLLFVLKNITFIFYAIGALIIAAAYWFVPVNKKFIAANKLQFGENRETGFYPHSVSTIEILEDEDISEMDEDEIEEATTWISTVRMTAYENMRGFLFAEGKISNQFLYIPKRSLTKQEAEDIRTFAEERCTGGYYLLETKNMVDYDDGGEEPVHAKDALNTSEVCDRYYGAKKLHLYDENGKRVSLDGADEAIPNEDFDGDEAVTEEATEDFNVEEEWERIIAEDAEDE